MKLFHVTALFLVALLAGCSDGTQGDFVEQRPERTPVGSASVATPTEGGPDAETGSILGQVMDDELRAIADAHVSLPGLGVVLQVDESGSFEFLGVPAGRQVVEAQAPGHGGASKRVTVVAGENTEANFLLSPLAVEEPFVDLESRVVYIEAAVSSYEHGCPNCGAWSIPYNETPTYIVMEVFGEHAISSPLRPDSLSFIVRKHGYTGDYIHNCSATEFFSACENLPIRVAINESVLTAMEPRGPIEKIHTLTGCERFWICVDEKYEIWVSSFYYWDEAAIPLDYSAKPG